MTKRRKPLLSDMDDLNALSAVQTRHGKPDRKRRCNQCQILFPPSDLHPDYNDEDRRVGWLCDGCY